MAAGSLSFELRLAAWAVALVKLIAWAGVRPHEVTNLLDWTVEQGTYVRLRRRGEWRRLATLRRRVAWWRMFWQSREAVVR